MAKRMTDVELDAFREALVTLTARGDEAAVKDHINTFFPRLPERMQQEIAVGLFTTALEDEARELEGK